MFARFGLPELLIVIFIAVGALLYFAPMVVAIRRKHPSMVGIAIVNMLFGWSLVGWVIALIWALGPLDQVGQRRRAFRGPQP